MEKVPITKGGRPWIVFFSQTGNEIVSLSYKLERWPDLIITNFRPKKRIIVKELQARSILVVPNRPTQEELESILSKYDNPLITLHGWLRIMPPSICKKYEIYNGHPGLITVYPQLKGKDPQEKAYQLGLSNSGCVIHKVSEGVDEGEIVLASPEIDISADSLDGIYRKLGTESIRLWLTFLNNKL